MKAFLAGLRVLGDPVTALTDFWYAGGSRVNGLTSSTSVHLVIGFLEMAAAFATFTGSDRARFATVVLAGVGAVVQPNLIPAHPFLATAVIVLDAIVVCSVSTARSNVEFGARAGRARPQAGPDGWDPTRWIERHPRRPATTARRCDCVAADAL
jgi:hypothetical protein